MPSEYSHISFPDRRWHPCWKEGKPEELPREASQWWYEEHKCAAPGEIVKKIFLEIPEPDLAQDGRRQTGEMWRWRGRWRSGGTALKVLWSSFNEEINMEAGGMSISWRKGSQNSKLGLYEGLGGLVLITWLLIMFKVRWGKLQVGGKPERNLVLRSIQLLGTEHWDCFC